MKITRIVEGAFLVLSNNMKYRNCGRRFGPKYYIAIGPKGGSYKVCPECARILAVQHNLSIEPSLRDKGRKD